MADLVLSPLLEGAIGKLASLLTDEVRVLQKESRKEIEKLSNTLTRFQSWHMKEIEKPSNKLIRFQYYRMEGRLVTEEAVRLWFKELKNVAYNAEDIVDELATELLDSKAMEDGDSTPENQVCCFSLPCLCLKQVTLSRKIGKRIREMREAIDEIMKAFRHRVSSEMWIATGERPWTDSFVIESEIYGRDEDKIAIVDMLLDNGSGTSEMEDLSVIPIVGLGGLGKTTLAQLAFNDKQVADHFEIKIWICVSDDFDVKRLAGEIIESMTRQQPAVSDMDQLESHLQQVLEKRRYLLVLDDVWNEDVERWNCMKALLRSCGCKGSKIIVTTRSEKVALIMGTTNCLYHLRFLSNDDCWSLFKENAFLEGAENVPLNLEQIGKEIVRKCKGVPLAAKALGRLMFFKREENDWLSVRDCEIWNLPEAQNDILPALRLSYNHLPAHLKQCFAYCSIFPKDYKFERETLIQQWIAQGFIQSSNGCRLAEDVGNEYFNDLLWRSFFQDIEKDGRGNIKKCKMHDLISDLARSVTSDSCFILDIDNQERIPYRSARHLSLRSGGSAKLFAMLIFLYAAKSLRTFIILESTELELSRAALDKMFLSFRLLRVLTITNYKEQELPTSIGNLILLRYFDISRTWIKKLPRSISNLKNLQTLILGCGFEELPQDLSGFKNLRHLDISRCYLLTCTPSKIGKLSFLQTFSTFIVSKDRGCGIGELHSLDLRGSIKIEKLENVVDVVDARHANLKGKHNLQKLGLFWTNNMSIRNFEEVLEGLHPHPNLKTLFVRNYNGFSFPRWLMDLMLPNLVHISLYNCQNCDLLPAFGSLPSLEILDLKKMHSVKCLSIEFDESCTVGVFPSLKKLYLHDMPKLEELPRTHGNDLFPCLEELIISCCPKLISLPRLSSLKNLYLHKSNSVILNSVASLTSLSFLGIYVFEELKFLPEAMLQSLNLLQSLQIRNCHNLRSLPRELENSTSLQELAIIDCKELECLPEELHYLTSLKLLDVCGCDSLISFPDKVMQSLTALERLSIQKCCKLTCLPLGFEHLTLLEDLTICDTIPTFKCFTRGSAAPHKPQNVYPRGF